MGSDWYVVKSTDVGYSFKQHILVNGPHNLRSHSSIEGTTHLEASVLNSYQTMIDAALKE